MRRGARWKQVGGRQAAVGRWTCSVLPPADCPITRSFIVSKLHYCSTLRRDGLTTTPLCRQAVGFRDLP